MRRTDPKRVTQSDDNFSSQECKEQWAKDYPKEDRNHLCQRLDSQESSYLNPADDPKIDKVNATHLIPDEICQLDFKEDQCIRVEGINEKVPLTCNIIEMMREVTAKRSTEKHFTIPHLIDKGL